MVPRRLVAANDTLIGQIARKLAGSALSPDAMLLDAAIGERLRFWDTGTDEPVVTPKRWARAVPLLQGLTIVTYTRAQVLFLADGFGRNCALPALHRVDEVAGNRLAFTFTRPETTLSILELKVDGPLDGFPERLLAARDERNKFPAKAQENFSKMDQLLRGRSADQIRYDWPSRGT